MLSLKLLTQFSLLFGSWAIIYLLVHLTTARSRSLLPSVYDRNRRRRPLRISTAQITLKYFHLRIQTTSWNTTHEALSARLATRRWIRIKRLLLIFYNTGNVVAVFGVACAYGFLVWTCIRVGLAVLYGPLSDLPHNEGPRLPKRVPELIHVAPPQSSLKPIIPGVTVPFMHLPFILVAVFTNQIIHEAGHALSAAVESVPLLSTGVSLLLVIPSAFVSLPPLSLAPLSIPSRLRIIAAGPFHNFILWCLFLTISQIVSLDWIMGYKDISAAGRIVVRVDMDSPLYDHLPSGSLITKLDDTSLGHATADVWTQYLTGVHTNNTKSVNGWCVDKEWYLERPQSCCLVFQPDAYKLSCFSSSDSEHRCIDPSPILTRPNCSRCVSSSDCNVPEASSCILPGPNSQLLRITLNNEGFSRKENQKNHVVLWSGPLIEVWEQVQTGKFVPYITIFPLWLPSIIQILLEYMKMAAASLYLFNLLPITFLDGGQIVNVLMDSLNDVPNDQLELEDVEHGRHDPGSLTYLYHGYRSNRVGKIISVTTVGLCGLCTILALMNTH